MALTITLPGLTLASGELFYVFNVHLRDYLMKLHFDAFAKLM